MAPHTEPRSITEAMATRANQWTLEPPPVRMRPATAAHTLDYSDVNEKAFRRRFRESAATRQQPPSADDVANVRPAFRSLPPRNTDVLNPAYTGLNGSRLATIESRVPTYGRQYVRAEGENFSLRTDDIDRCLADAFYRKYGAFVTRPTNRVDDIFGAQHDTKCREPQVWRASGPYVDPGRRHYPEALPTKRVNRVDDIEGAQAARSSVPAPVRRYYAARAAEEQAEREFAVQRAASSLLPPDHQSSSG